MPTRKLIKILQISIFSAIAVILTFVEIPLFFVPNFYKIDFSDTIVLISSFLLGPVAGFLTEFLKILLKLCIKGSATFGLGDLANFVSGISLMLPSAIFYKKFRNFKGACIAMGLGIICLTIVSAISNYFIFVPAYEKLFSVSENNIISFSNAINPLIVDRFTFILFAVIPFNLLKGILVCLFAFIIYKKLSPKIDNLINNFVK